jgi:response regulator RpfG family c-di-GMP phosphodiesterase
LTVCHFARYWQICSQPLSREEARSHIAQESGSYFDPDFVAEFFNIGAIFRGKIMEYFDFKQQPSVALQQ